MTLEEKVFCLQMIIVVLTFIQSLTNFRTLKEMKKSREGNFAPLLTPKIGAKKKGGFDAAASYYYDAEVRLELTSGSQKSIPLSPFDITITNDGQGPAIALEIKGVDPTSDLQTKGVIPLIKVDESKQVRVLVFLAREPDDGETISIVATYENVFGEKYNQEWRLILDRALSTRHEIIYNKAERIS